MKVVILAGGMGSRLQSVVKNVAKPMADIGGTPFLELLLENLRRFGAENFILCVSHLRETIQRHFGDQYKDIPVYYSIEEKPLGTGGAIRQAFAQFNLESALVLNGDTFVQADYARFERECAGETLAVMLTTVDNANRYGRVETKDGRIVFFREKSPTEEAGLINAGVYNIQAKLFANMPEGKFSFEKELLEPRVAEIQPKFFRAEDYFIDIGVPESYAQACRELKEVIGGAGRCKALFLDRDGVINVDKRYVHKIEDCEFVEGIFDVCRSAKAKGYKLIVVTNQAGIAKGYFTEEDFASLMDYIKAEFIRQGCPLDDIFYCPYHVDGQGKYRKESEDRKPNPGMILKAVKKHNIDLKKSILIGDKESDLEAGRRAGIMRLIRVEESNLWGIEEI